MLYCVWVYVGRYQYFWVLFPGLYLLPDQMKNLSTLKLDQLLQHFPGIKVEQQVKDTPRSVSNYHFCRSQPKVRNQPQLYGLSQSAVELIGLSYGQVVNDADSPLYLSGSTLIQGSQPLAQNYCGYQFGSWAGQLGDGRAHTLGFAKGIKSKRYELQLKGSGLTPFSRHADGNSVVSSAVREFLASELMVGLSIPTTRALSLVVAKQPVKRDPFYNGNIKLERAAIVLRMCESFLRFGSLQVCLPDAQMHQTSPLDNRKILQPICDFAIQQHFPDISPDDEDPYEELYKRLVKHSAQLVAHWQSIGFCHGVLNTDNMSMGGVTIDYGPYAFIDFFSKDFVSNATDDHQRYSFRRQPEIVKWNLQRLAQAMDPLFPYSISKKYLNENYQNFYSKKYYTLMSNKLGLKDNAESQALIDQLTEIMHFCGTHFTNFFRLIEEHSKNPFSIQALTAKAVQFSQPAEFYLKSLRSFPQLIDADYRKMLKYDTAFNTFFIQQQMQRLQTVQRLSQQHCKDRHAKQSQKWQQWMGRYIKLRNESVDRSIRNPRYVLLNYIARQIIEQIEQASPEESRNLLSKVLDVFSNPYERNEWFEENYWSKPPVPVKLTCSS